MRAWKKSQFRLAILILILLFISTTTVFAKSNKTNPREHPFVSRNPHSPQKVRLTNVRDTQFTVSWITKRKTIGKINYGPTPGLGKTAYDDRGEATQGQVHHVTVRHLMPNTLYYFGIISENKMHKNDNKLYICHTGPTIIPVECDVAYGRIYQRFGRRHRIPYGKEALVYLTLIDKDGNGSVGESVTESTMLETNSYWSKELANLRENDLSQLFDYSDTGDALKIEVETGIYPTKEIIVGTGSDSPAEDIELIRGGKK